MKQRPDLQRESSPDGKVGRPNSAKVSTFLQEPIIPFCRQPLT